MEDYAYGKTYIDPKHVSDGGVTPDHVRRWKVLQELQAGQSLPNDMHVVNACSKAVFDLSLLIGSSDCISIRSVKPALWAAGEHCDMTANMPVAPVQDLQQKLMCPYCFSRPAGQE